MPLLPIIEHKLSCSYQMRAVVQRVSSASVTIDGIIKSAIGAGILILLGVCVDDTEDDAAWLSKKIASLRIFSDSAGLMNIDIKELDGGALVVSQFTLYASYKKGNRPSFIAAARPEHAIPLYEYFVGDLQSLLAKEVRTGVFGADMKVSLVNDGPVTIVIDSKNRE